MTLVYYKVKHGKVHIFPYIGSWSLCHSLRRGDKELMVVYDPRPDKICKHCLKEKLSIEEK